MTDFYRVTGISEEGACLPTALAWLKSDQIVTCKDLIEECARRGMNKSPKAIRLATSKACKNGSLEKISGWEAGLPTVIEWQKSLGRTKFVNSNPGKRGTKYTYLNVLDKFNSWLAGKKFNVTVYINGNSVQKNISFQNVEEMLKYLAGPVEQNRHIKMIIKKYLHEPIHNGKKANTVMVAKNAIVSYITYHDFDIYIEFDAKKVYNSDMPHKEFTLFDMQMMLQAAGRRDRAILACKFQRGLDLSTLTDQFNHKAYSLISDYFGTTDYTKWDPAKCPVPIKLKRVKVNYIHLGFIDVDALNAVISYLNMRAEKGHKFGRDLPLFVTKRGTPISSNAVIHIFEKMAKKAGLRDGPVKVGSHEVRDLLKSTMIHSGCRPDVSEHVLGHKPRDTYEKQALLYPESIRAEYAKASKMINVLTHTQNIINGRMAEDSRIKNIAGIAHELLYRIRSYEQDKRDLVNANMHIDKLNNMLDTSNRINVNLLERIDILRGTIGQLSGSGVET